MFIPSLCPSAASREKNPALVLLVPRALPCNSYFATRMHPMCAPPRAAQAPRVSPSVAARHTLTAQGTAQLS